MGQKINDLEALMLRDGFDFDSKLSELEQEKKHQQLLGKESTANSLWAMIRLVDIYKEFVNLFNILHENKYYDAWCKAEEIEILIHSLLLNFPGFEPYVKDIAITVSNLQRMYPYRLFISTVFRIKKEKCSICGKTVSIRNLCPHICGRVYNGELCQREVEQCELIGADIVTNPEHKYSVLFPSDGNGKAVDHYDYTNVERFSKVWNRPFMRITIKISSSLHENLNE